MKPLLAHIYSPTRVTYPCFMQPKLDGVRALYQNGHFQSREELPWNASVLEHLAAHLRVMFNPSCILDGELYVHGWPLQRINGAVQVARSAPSKDTASIEYHVFDTVLYTTPFAERWKFLESHTPLFADTPIKLVPTRRIHNESEGDDFYATTVAAGFEGVMYRLGDCPYTTPKQELWDRRCSTGVETYTPQRHLGINSRYYSDKNNRTWHLLKRKDWQDGEFECLSVEEGIGKRAGMVGAFVCATKSGVRFRVGSGISDAQATHYLSNPPIGSLIKVKYRVLTSDGTPFHPTVIAIL